MEPMYVKAAHAGTIRRLSVSSADCEGLRAEVAAAFDLPTPSAVAFTWVDDEGDAVALSTDTDMKEARRVGGGVLRLTLAPAGALDAEPKDRAAKVATAAEERRAAKAALVANAPRVAQMARVAKVAKAKAARELRTAAAKEAKAAAAADAKAARQAAAAAAREARVAAAKEAKAANRSAAVAARKAAKAAAATDGEAVPMEDNGAGVDRVRARSGRGGGRRGRDGKAPNWGVGYFSPGALGADAGAPVAAAHLCGGGMDAAVALLYSIPSVASALAAAGRGRGFWHVEQARRGVGAATEAAVAVAMRAVAAEGVGLVSRAAIDALNREAGRAFVAHALEGGSEVDGEGKAARGPALDPEAIDGAVDALKGSLADAGVSADGAVAISAGVRAVLSERVVGKTIRWLAAAADHATDEAAAEAVATQLATHPPCTRCVRCNVSPIVGTRYRPAAEAAGKADGDLCGDCYDAAVHADDYQALPHPWLAAPAYAAVTAPGATDGDTAAVPPAQLRFYARGPRVTHLQAMLLAGGHLSPRDVVGNLGWYGPATRAAVAAVQAEAGIVERVREVGSYDRMTQAVLLASVQRPEGTSGTQPGLLPDTIDTA